MTLLSIRDSGIGGLWDRSSRPVDFFWRGYVDLDTVHAISIRPHRFEMEQRQQRERSKRKKR